MDLVAIITIEAALKKQGHKTALPEPKQLSKTNPFARFSAVTTSSLPISQPLASSPSHNPYLQQQSLAEPVNPGSFTNFQSTDQAIPPPRRPQSTIMPSLHYNTSNIPPPTNFISQETIAVASVSSPSSTVQLPAQNSLQSCPSSSETGPVSEHRGSTAITTTLEYSQPFSNTLPLDPIALYVQFADHYVFMARVCNKVLLFFFLN